MVRFTYGVTVPFAVSSVGKARVSAFAVLNNCGFSTEKTSGSTVTGALLAAAGVSFEQPTPHITKASSVNSGISRRAAPFQPHSIFIGSPHGPQTGSTAPQPSNTIPPDSRNSTAPRGNRSPY